MIAGSAQSAWLTSYATAAVLTMTRKMRKMRTMTPLWRQKLSSSVVNELWYLNARDLHLSRHNKPYRLEPKELRILRLLYSD
jgi:hypothetical protein